MATSQSPPGAINLTSIDDPESFFLEGRYQGYCALCAYLDRPQVVKTWEVHHVLSKQHCRRYQAPRHSPDNALRLCAKSPDACHERHTTHQELLPVACLRDENIAFAVRWLGVGPALVYFETYYAGTDPRLDHLLEQP